MECEPPEGAKGPKTRIPLKIEENLAGFILGALALITFANVLVRYLTDFSFAFTEEFSIFLMVVMTLLGSSSLMAKNG
ncbi:MAG: TRAP transporter small permease subunit, partial [Desulfobacteraceae bacterium]|nr:TRAP transporter small permease subunit [Desulfobacteraceae bacterium]